MNFRRSILCGFLSFAAVACILISSVPAIASTDPGLGITELIQHDLAAPLKVHADHVAVLPNSLPVVPRRALDRSTHVFLVVSTTFSLNGKAPLFHKRE